MEYRGKEIGIPTVEMFCEYVQRQGYGFPPKIAFDRFKKKGWLTNHGTPIKSLEQAVNAYNGVFVERQRRNRCFAGSLF